MILLAVVPSGLAISGAEWEILRSILNHYLPRREVWAFGSRVTGQVKRYSDLDLMICGDQPTPLSVTASIQDDLLESDLPYRVDLVDWATASERFRGIVQQNYIVIAGPERQ